MQPPESTSGCGRLKADLIDRVVTGSIRLPKREVLAKAGVSVHQRTAMLQGAVLPWECFADLLTALRRHIPQQVTGLTLEDIAEPAEGPPDDPLMPDVLLHRGWADVLKIFRGGSCLSPRSFCDPGRDSDFEEMADLVLDSLGWHSFSTRGEAKLATRERARAKGEELSGMGFEQWVPWLRDLCRGELRTTMFAVGDVRSGSVKRVAAGVGEGGMAVAFAHAYLALPR